MSADLVLINAKIFTDKGIQAGGIAVKDGKICAVCKTSKLPKAHETIDVEDRIILPGLNDVHTHLRDHQLAYKEEYNTGT